ncbi:hypothetical protein AX15_002698 [Amanita polypyramis BW_CC]|nr:hypothetical protein AX15_002698 [Amanita polypyramis BW_CC]
MNPQESVPNDYSSSSQTAGSPPFPPSTQRRSTSMQDLPLTDLLGQPFQEFDHRRDIIEPFSEETECDRSFQEEFATMLLDALVESHAWTIARLKHEDIVSAERFERKISEIMAMEKEQGMLLRLRSSSSSSLSSGMLGNSVHRVILILHVCTRINGVPWFSQKEHARA